MRAAAGILITLVLLGAGGAMLGLGFIATVAHITGKSEGLIVTPLILLPGLVAWYSAGIIGAWSMDRLDRHS